MADAGIRARGANFLRGSYAATKQNIGSTGCGQPPFKPFKMFKTSDAGKESKTV